MSNLRKILAGVAVAYLFSGVSASANELNVELNLGQPAPVFVAPPPVAVYSPAYVSAPWVEGYDPHHRRHDWRYWHDHHDHHDHAHDHHDEHWDHDHR